MSNVVELMASIGVDAGDIQHHGVKGMKWGVRKNRTSSVNVVNKQGQKTPIKYDPNKTTINDKGEIHSNSRREARSVQRQINKASQPKPVKTPNTFRVSPQNRRASDAELRAKVNRLLLEKQYKDLTASPKGEKFFKTLLKESGQRAARTLATKAVDAAIGVALDKAAGKATGTNKLLLEAMAGNGKKKKDK